MPLKQLGQNFLVNQALARKIARAAQKFPPPWVEIGPGLGALTNLFLPAEKENLILIERDKKLAAYWESRGARVFFGDALKISWRDLPPRLTLFGNLPYHIAGPLIMESLPFRERIHGMVFMMQREAAQRALARPGGKDYGPLSVVCSLFWRARVLAEALESDFFPAPKVRGRVLAFEPKENAWTDDLSGFLRFVKNCFSQRRKMLLRRLPLPAAGASLPQAKEIFSDMSLDFKIRAEAISPEQFLELFLRCRALSAGPSDSRSAAGPANSAASSASSSDKQA